MVARPISIPQWALVAALGAAFFAPAAARVYFDAPWYSVVADVPPADLIVADIDDDGRPDLVIPSLVGPEVAVEIGDAEGEFTTTSNLSTPGDFKGFTVVDLDSDGNLDVAVVTSGAGLSIFNGHGDGTFGPRADFGAGAEYFAPVAAGDVDNDGRMDVVLAHTGTSLLYTYRQIIPGYFFPVTSFLTGVSLRALAVNRFDGDASLDVVGLDETGNAVVLLHGLGDGTFTPVNSVPLQVSARDLEIGALNDDGHMDVVTTGGTGWVSVLLGTGTSAFAPRLDFTTGTNPSHLALADVSGDEHLDAIVASSGNSKFAVAVGTGNGAFPTFVEYADESGLVEVAAADVNGDARPEVIAAHSNGGSVSIHTQNADGSFDAPFIHLSYTSEVILYPTPKVELGDVDGDGRDDMVLPLENKIAVYRNGGDGKTWTVTDIAVPWASHVALGDVNGDGDLDIVTCSVNDGGGALVLFGDGNGGFVTGATFFGATYNVFTAQLDADSIVDVVLMKHSNLSVYRGGSLTLMGGAPYSSSTIHWMDAGDVNGDGAVDLLHSPVESSSLAEVLLGDGQGDFGAPSGLGGPQVEQVRGIRVMHADMDDHLDVLVAAGFELQVRHGHGDGTFDASQVVELPRLPEGLGTLDANGDGRLDLLTPNCNTSGSVTLSLATTKGSFRPVQYYPVVPSGSIDTASRSVITGNLNGDAIPDAVVCIPIYQSLNVLLGRPQHPVDVPEMIAPPGGMSIRVHPARHSFRVEYNLSRVADVRLTLHDVRGRLVQVLDQGRRAPGPHTLTWEPRSAGTLARGVYFVRLGDGKHFASGKIVVLHH